MISTILTIILILLFFFLGLFTQALKKIIELLAKIILKVLSIFGIKIAKKEKRIKVSNEFKEVYKDIKKVKLSKKNIKQQSSIDWVYLSVLVVALILFIVNMESITGMAISNWLYTWLPSIPLIGKIFASSITTYTYYTAILFSIMSFALSKLLTRWKETKQQRVERKAQKLKRQAIELMDSKELVDAAKKKDDEEYKRLK